LIPGDEKIPAGSLIFFRTGVEIRRFRAEFADFEKKSEELLFFYLLLEHGARFYLCSAHVQIWGADAPVASSRRELKISVRHAEVGAMESSARVAVK
jgi:hypothetical protein